jgi:hypothetical protein
MDNLEDVLIGGGETPAPAYPCASCSTLRPPFMLDAAMLCSTCEIEADRIETEATIAMLRDAKKAEITAWRDRRDLGGAPTPLGIMDSDSASIVKITGAVQMAQIALTAGEPFAIGWTMKDNATAEHDALQMIAAGVAVGQFIAANHAISVALKAQADAATSAADLDLIIWPEE